MFLNPLKYREEKTGIPTELGAWPVEETSWYLGSEPKRGAPYNLNITFIPKNEEVILTGCIYVYIVLYIVRVVQKFSSVKTLGYIYCMHRCERRSSLSLVG